MCFLTIIAKYRKLNPTILSRSVIISAIVVSSSLPCIIVCYKIGILAKPAIKHIAFLVKKILLSINILNVGNSKLIVLISVSLTICTEVHPSVVSILISGVKSNPLVGNHSTVLVYIVEIVVGLNNLVHCHVPIRSKIEPIVSGLSPSVSDWIAIVV